MSCLALKSPLSKCLIRALPTLGGAGQGEGGIEGEGERKGERKEEQEDERAGGRETETEAEADGDTEMCGACWGALAQR